jgi:hypothetical protein
MRLLPLRRLSASILPLVSSGAWTAKDADKLRGGNLGKVVLEGHGQIIPQKKKCAMQKIMLAMHTRKGHLSLVRQPHHQMKTIRKPKVTDKLIKVAELTNRKTLVKHESRERTTYWIIFPQVGNTESPMVFVESLKTKGITPESESNVIRSAQDATTRTI